MQQPSLGTTRVIPGSVRWRWLVNVTSSILEPGSGNDPLPQLTRCKRLLVMRSLRQRVLQVTLVASVISLSARVSFADIAQVGAEHSNALARLPLERRPSYALAVNPVFVPFGTLSAEYEMSAFRPMTTLGVSAWYEYRDIRARWLYLKALVYPWGVALRGLGLGVTFGVVRAYREPTEPAQLAQDTAATIGAMAQYNFVFGPNDLMLIGVGLGARTPLALIAKDSPLNRLDGDGRIVAGVVF
jgi:hypothetical protein